MARIWASNTQNKTNLTDQQISNGFVYQSEVKSDFFNGAVNSVAETIFKTINFDPYVGGRKGDIVRVVLSYQNHSTRYSRYRDKWDYYICLKDTSAGPIFGARGPGILRGALFYSVRASDSPNTHPDWQKITKLVQPPNVTIKYRPRNNGELMKNISECRSVGQIDVSRVNFLASSLQGVTLARRKTEESAYWNTANNTSFVNMFDGNPDITSLDLSKWDVSNGTTFGSMFFNCTNLTSLDLSNWDVSNGTDFTHMFSDCTNLTSLDLSKWDVSSGTFFSHMFSDCANLTSLDLSKWDVSKGTLFSHMFFNCANLTSLDLSKWDVSKGTDFTYMFFKCTNLTSLDLSKWDVSKGTDFSYMFYLDSNLRTIGNCSGWDVSKGTNFDAMFNSCSVLTDAGDLSGWNVSPQASTYLVSYNCGIPKDKLPPKFR